MSHRTPGQYECTTAVKLSDRKLYMCTVYRHGYRYMESCMSIAAFEVISGCCVSGCNLQLLRGTPSVGIAKFINYCATISRMRTIGCDML
jgi:hypothetical protein